MPIEDSTNYEQRFSMLLTAYVTKEAIDVSYYECHGSLIKAGSIQIKY